MLSHDVRCRSIDQIPTVYAARVFEIEIEHSLLSGGIPGFVLGHQDQQTGIAVLVDARLQSLLNIVQCEIIVLSSYARCTGTPMPMNLSPPPYSPFPVLNQMGRLARFGSAAFPSSRRKAARVDLHCVASIDSWRKLLGGHLLQAAAKGVAHRGKNFVLIVCPAARCETPIQRRGEDRNRHTSIDRGEWSNGLRQNRKHGLQIGRESQNDPIALARPGGI